MSSSRNHTRTLFRQTKAATTTSSTTTSRIRHPFAHHDSITGVVTCTLCHITIDSLSSWSQHLSSSLHRNNTSTIRHSSIPLKRPNSSLLSTSSDDPIDHTNQRITKLAKLVTSTPTSKNSTVTSLCTNYHSDTDDESDVLPSSSTGNRVTTSPSPPHHSLPTDFFDTNSSSNLTIDDQDNSQIDTLSPSLSDNDLLLPSIDDTDPNSTSIPDVDTILRETQLETLHLLEDNDNILSLSNNNYNNSSLPSFPSNDDLSINDPDTLLFTTINDKRYQEFQLQQSQLMNRFNQLKAVRNNSNIVIDTEFNDNDNDNNDQEYHIPLPFNSKTLPTLFTSPNKHNNYQSDEILDNDSDDDSEFDWDWRSRTTNTTITHNRPS